MTGEQTYTPVGYVWPAFQSDCKSVWLQTGLTTVEHTSVLPNSGWLSKWLYMDGCLEKSWGTVEVYLPQFPTALGATRSVVPLFRARDVSSKVGSFRSTLAPAWTSGTGGSSPISRTQAQPRTSRVCCLLLVLRLPGAACAYLLFVVASGRVFMYQ